MDLWTFACAFYADRKVQQQLLMLQDEQSLNVNHVLLGVWTFAEKGQQVVANTLCQRERRTGLVSQLIEPVRLFRRDSKTKYSPSVYLSMKNIELRCERLHLDWLAEIQSDVSVVSANNTVQDKCNKTQFINYIAHYLKDLLEETRESRDESATERSVLDASELANWFDVARMVLSSD